MSTYAEAEAKWRAQLSTGPKTAAGKARSRRNALKKGYTAKTVLLPGEDPKEYEALRTKLFAEYNPTSALASCNVDRLASLLWRLRRIPRFEQEIVSTIQEEVRLPTTDNGEPAPPSTVGSVIKAMLDGGQLEKLSQIELSLAKQAAVLTQLLDDGKNMAQPVVVNILRLSDSGRRPPGR